MNEEVKKQIFNEIKAYDRIILSRHIRPDGDAVGSTLGFSRILKLTFPEKEILVINEEPCDYVDFLGKEDEQIEDSKYENALAIVIDTATIDRVSNKKITLAKKILKIDHHVDDEPFGDIYWVEDQRSSACEMIVDFFLTFKDELKIDKDAALCLYTGMVTDSGRFRFNSTSGETLRMAGFLLDQGLDTDTLFARLYLEDFDYLKFQAYVYKKMGITENGVCHVYVDAKMQKRFHLTHEQASNVVSLLGEIKGSIIWLAFIDNEDKSIRVRLRSRFVTVNKLANKYRGGGHECASGATVYNKKEIKALIADADKLSKEFKENNFYL